MASTGNGACSLTNLRTEDGASVFATMFGGVDQVSSLAALAALPVAAWKLSLGLWAGRQRLQARPDHR